MSLEMQLKSRNGLQMLLLTYGSWVNTGSENMFITVERRAQTKKRIEESYIFYCKLFELKLSFI